MFVGDVYRVSYTRHDVLLTLHGRCGSIFIDLPATDYITI